MTKNWSAVEEECENQHKAFCAMVNEYYSDEVVLKQERKDDKTEVTFAKREARDVFQSNWKAITAFLQKPNAELWATFSPVVGWSMGNSHPGSGPPGDNYWYPTFASTLPDAPSIKVLREYRGLEYKRTKQKENMATVPDQNWQKVVKSIRLTTPVSNVDNKAGPVNLNNLVFELVQKTPLPITYLTAPP